MKHRMSTVIRSRRLLVALAVVVISAGGVGMAVAGSSAPKRPIEENQTDGYGNEKLVAFTYFMNFDCVTEPSDDLDQDGKRAEVDPDEFQTPRCVVGREPTRDPTGDPVSGTEPLFVILPFFDADGDGQASGEVGGPPSEGFADALKGLFGGLVPDAFDPTPGVPVQCPEPGLPLTKHRGDYGTCTMHPSKVDVGPALGIPGGLLVPTPNHSHIIDGASFGDVWWQVKVVLVNDPSVWPDVAGTRGLNSVADLRRAQRQGKASDDITTNFFLFFDSRELRHDGATAARSARRR